MSSARRRLVFLSIFALIVGAAALEFGTAGAAFSGAEIVIPAAKIAPDVVKDTSYGKPASIVIFLADQADVSAANVPSMDFARSLIEREHVAVAPGSAFGDLGEGYVRLSLASSREDLLDGASRLVRFVHLLGEVRR